MTGTDLATAALTLVGTPFRLHGRDPASGLDCIGVLEAALARAGKPARLPNGYPLRARRLPDLHRTTAMLGLDEADGNVIPGDVVMLRVSPCQLHLAIAMCPMTAVHAHAGLRKVVLAPLPLEWPRIAHWRLSPHSRN